MRREPNERRIADLHCHYPMRVHCDRSPAAVAKRRECSGAWFWLDGVRCFAMRRLAQLFNHKSFWATWRVTFDGLKAGRAGLVLSALYDPAYEILVMPGKQQPRPAAFGALLCQLGCVEAELVRTDPGHDGHRVVKSKAELKETLNEGRMAFVHCVEGGLYLGDNVCDIKTNVARLAEKGVAYITVAHLFYRGIASNASALPGLSDECYDFIFRQRLRGLSPLGRAVVEAMYEHKMLIDITHMDAPAVQATFKRLEELDEETGADPKEHPVIASHAGYRFGDLDYMLDKTTIEEIARRGGVIGLILAEHQLENGFTGDEIESSTFYALDRHIKKICQITHSHEHICIGSDHDGFIKPTVSGIHGSAELGEIEEWLRDDYPPAVADAILFGNAERVVASALP